MVNQITDICIIGVGAAGAFALQKLLKENKNLNILVIDAGRAPAKRRHQIFGFLGCLPSSDGKLYLNDLPHVSNIAGYKKTSLANSWVIDQLEAITPMRMIKDKRPSQSAEKRIKKYEFEMEFNNYYQLYPRDIHSYSRLVVQEMEKNNNQIMTSFDNEVLKLLKHKNYFSIITANGDFQAKKVLVSVGRGGWRWVSELFSNFGIIENNDIARFGIRVEMPETYMKDFAHSNCTLRYNMLEAGPLSHNGTTVPEDYIDFAGTAFRSNETRWASDKVSFNLITEKYYPENGYQQVERMAKLAFILGNDRMSREKISTYMNKKSKLSALKEYDGLRECFEILNNIMPDLLEKGSMYFPTIIPFPPQIKLNRNFETEVKDMFVAGESAGIPGLLGAAVSGCIASEAILKG